MNRLEWKYSVFPDSLHMAFRFFSSHSTSTHLFSDLQEELRGTGIHWHFPTTEFAVWEYKAACHVGVSGIGNPVLNSDLATASGRQTDFWIWIHSSGQRLKYLPKFKNNFPRYVNYGCQLWKHLFVLAQVDCVVQYHTKSSSLQTGSTAMCMQTQSTSNRKKRNVGKVTQRWVYLGSFSWQKASCMWGSGGKKAKIKERQSKKPKFCFKSVQSLYLRIIVNLHSCILILLFLILLWMYLLLQEIQAQKIAYSLSWKWQIDKSPRALSCCEVKGNYALFQNNYSC